MYPWDKNPYYGIFVKEQIDGLSKYYNLDYQIMFINGKLGKWQYLQSIFKINNHLKKNHYDLIHIHYGLSGLFSLMNNSTSIPIVLTLHSGDIDERKSKYVQIQITKKVIRKSAQVIILNDEMYDLVIPFNKNLSRIPCGVNTAIFKPLKMAVPAVEKNVTLVFPGSPGRKAKNFPLFKKVVEVLENKYSKTVEYEILENKSREEIAMIFNAADCVVMTSYSEGSPQVIKEAMACNTNIVSTNVGDVEVLLKNVNNAKVVGFDANDLADAVVEVLKFTGNKNGHSELLNQELDEESISRRLFCLYEKTLAR